MLEELKKLENLFIRTYGKEIHNLNPEPECEEYAGYNFQMGNQNFKFRKSKITPKKLGQFVTLWKRNAQKQTEPFDENDNFDFYIFASEENEKLGYFIFSKELLIKKNILSTKTKEGKRGFRLYPSWVKTENKQAEKTQMWQSEFFIDFTQEETKNSEVLKSFLI